MQSFKYKKYAITQDSIKFYVYFYAHLNKFH